jgi:hypothetical protein
MAPLWVAVAMAALVAKRSALILQLAPLVLLVAERCWCLLL